MVIDIFPWANLFANDTDEIGLGVRGVYIGGESTYSNGVTVRTIFFFNISHIFFLTRLEVFADTVSKSEGPYQSVTATIECAKGRLKSVDVAGLVAA